MFPLPKTHPSSHSSSNALSFHPDPFPSSPSSSTCTPFVPNSSSQCPHSNQQEQPRHYRQHRQGHTFTASATKQTKLTRRHRPSRRVLESRSSAIFGHWDIDLRPTAAHTPSIDNANKTRVSHHATLSASSISSSPQHGLRHGPKRGHGGGGGGGGGSEAEVFTGPAVSSSATGNTVGQSVISSTLPSTTTSATANTTTTTTTISTIPSPSLAQPTSVSLNPHSDTSMQKMSRTSTNTASATNDHVNNTNTTNPFSARASFMRALSRFKHKSKRASVPLPVSQSTPMSSLGNVSANDSNVPASIRDIADRRSFVLPPIHIGDEAGTLSATKKTSVESESESKHKAPTTEEKQNPSPALADIPASVDHDTEMTKPMAQLSLADDPSSLSMDHDSSNVVTKVNSNDSQVSHDSNDHGGPSARRIKFKNRVSHTLASIMSASNLRDKAKAQNNSDKVASLPITTVSPSGQTSAVTTMSEVTESEDPQSLDNTPSRSNKNRQSKTFWTFPRVRLESTKPRPSSMTALRPVEKSNESAPTSGTNAVAMDKAMDTEDKGLCEDKKEADDDEKEELDSDNSIDFILPADYDDYTQFAELPLKKRKKMEAAFAANGTLPSSYSNKRRPNSVRASADAMKRFMTASSQHSTESSKSKSKSKCSKELNGTDTLTRSTGEHWRRSLLKSLHLERHSQSLHLSSTTSSSVSAKAPFEISALAKHEAEKEPAAEGHQSNTDPVTRSGNSRNSGNDDNNVNSNDNNGQALVQSRLARSNSVQSIRSRSMATATHAGLLATTTLPSPRSPGLRRETLEMAMRRRRQSSAARSNISDGDLLSPFPRSSEFFGLDNYSTTNITHTFTSFTLELSDMYAQDVMNNSAIPGLFNFKRRATRMTISSMYSPEFEADHSFRGFESDGDAISGYTGDADISMDESTVQKPMPKTPTFLSVGTLEHGARSSTPVKGLQARRKLSSVDGDSDTVSELPTLMIRTRDLNSRPVSFNSGMRTQTPRPTLGTSFEFMEQDQQEARDDPSRASAAAWRAPSPTMTRKTSRIVASSTSVSASAFAVGESSSPTSPKSPSKNRPMSMQEIKSWKPREPRSPRAMGSMSGYSFQARPLVPALDTRKRPASSSTKGSGATVSSSTTLVPSSKGTPIAQFLTHSPGAFDNSPVLPLDTINEGAGDGDGEMSGQYHHRQQSSMSSSTTLGRQFSQHAKGISGVSTLSASSEYTMPSSGRFGRGNEEIAEFDPSLEFSATTPVDLKGLDFEALLATAEREQQRGWDNLKNERHFLQSQQSQQSWMDEMPHRQPLHNNTNHARVHKENGFQPRNQQALKIAHSTTGPSSALKSSSYHGNSIPQFNITKSAVAPLRSSYQQNVSNSVAFDLAPSDENAGTGTGSDRSNRSKRVMKKKMSVIRLAGNGSVQGKREQDGVIRVSMSHG
ncbi:hypothetical protein BGZ94_006498 [Podila epigama]|nr:hypothetical protein BGZ94_006498 [Podila epigama]